MKLNSREVKTFVSRFHLTKSELVNYCGSYPAPIKTCIHLCFLYFRLPASIDHILIDTIYLLWLYKS